jgi:hypothetical protein
VISRLELLLLLSAADGDQQADAVAHLIHMGDSSFVLKDSAIVGLDNTVQGNARLRAMTLPTAIA